MTCHRLAFKSVTWGRLTSFDSNTSAHTDRVLKRLVRLIELGHKRFTCLFAGAANPTVARRNMTLPGENGQNLVEWRFRKEQTRGKVVVFGRKLRVSSRPGMTSGSVVFGLDTALSLWGVLKPAVFQTLYFNPDRVIESHVGSHNESCECTKTVLLSTYLEFYCNLWEDRNGFKSWLALRDL